MNEEELLAGRISRALTDAGVVHGQLRPLPDVSLHRTFTDFNKVFVKFLRSDSGKTEGTKATLASSLGIPTPKILMETETFTAWEYKRLFAFTREAVPDLLPILADFHEKGMALKPAVAYPMDINAQVDLFRGRIRGKHYPREKDVVTLVEGLGQDLQAALPLDETILHGDLTISNLALDHRDHPLVLDWEGLRRGHPIFDLASLHCSLLEHGWASEGWTEPYGLVDLELLRLATMFRVLQHVGYGIEHGADTVNHHLAIVARLR